MKNFHAPLKKFLLKKFLKNVIKKIVENFVDQQLKLNKKNIISLYKGVKISYT